MLVYWFLFSCLNFILPEVDLERVITQADAGSVPFCTTPKNETGACILLSSCQSLKTLIKTNGRDDEVVNLVRQSVCGPPNGPPKVCCPAITPPLTTSNSTEAPVKLASSSIRPSIADESWRRCGRISIGDRRIHLGGSNAVLGDWPWTVALGYRTAMKSGPIFQCAGSLISKRWVITAAHCVHDLPGSVQLVVVRLGDLDLNDSATDGAAPFDAPIQQIIPHPRYSRKPAVINDIALLQLKDSVQLTSNILPICLLSGAEFKADSYYMRRRLFVTGWGRFEENGPTRSWLQETSYAIFNTSYCAQVYSNQPRIIINDTVLCAGEPGKDTCQVDSGSPLMIANVSAGAYYLAGIVSYGVGCLAGDYPGVNTRVAAFTDWIRQVTGLDV